MYWKMLLAAFIFGASTTASFSQVVPPGERRGIPLSLGVGYSNFESDFSGRISGIAVWADWNFYQTPAHLRGLGIEVEGRDLSFGRTGTMPNLRFDTIAGGAIYTFRHYRRFHPYGKFLLGFGSMDFISSIPTYTHDTREFFAPGGGLDYRLTRTIWLRGDYQYQIWPDFGRPLHPNGFTIGASYDFYRR
jgi:opacity protein-like surface antigen